MVDEEARLPEDPIQKALYVHYNSTVHYPEALPGAELKYNVSGQSLKETITFPRLDSVLEELTYEIWAEGMTAEKAAEGEIRFAADGKVVFKLPAPFLMDSEGNTLDKVEVKNLANYLKETDKDNIATIVFDGVISQNILDISSGKGIKTLVGKNKGKISKLPAELTVWTRTDLL